jgi:hypothetical protein
MAIIIEHPVDSIILLWVQPHLDSEVCSLMCIRLHTGTCTDFMSAVPLVVVFFSESFST